MLEKRSYRAELQAGERLIGYAVLWDVESVDMGGWRERIAPDAFVWSDVRALWQHDPRYVLGRLSTGTLEIESDKRGLRVSITPPDATWARDVIESVRRGDVDQMSFAFRVLEDKWDKMVRTVMRAELVEVSIVTFPAYEVTSVQVAQRSRLEIMRKRIRLMEVI